MQQPHQCPTPGQCRCPSRPAVAAGVSTRAGVAAVKAAWRVNVKANKKTMNWSPMSSMTAQAAGARDRRSSWLNAETFYMLKIFKDNGIPMKLLVRREQTYTFKSVQRIMALKGYCKSADQIRVKWKHLKAFYNDAKRKATPDSFPYYAEMAALMEPLLQAGHRDNSSDESPERDQRDTTTWTDSGPIPTSSASSTVTSAISTATSSPSPGPKGPQRWPRSADQQGVQVPAEAGEHEEHAMDVEWLDVEHMKQERVSDDEGSSGRADPISVATTSPRITATLVPRPQPQSQSQPQSQPMPQPFKVELVRLPKRADARPPGGCQPVVGSQPRGGPRPLFNLVRQTAPSTGPTPGQPPVRLLVVQKGRLGLAGFYCCE